MPIAIWSIDLRLMKVLLFNLTKLGANAPSFFIVIL